MNDNPLVSVIITTKNEASHIRQLLESIKNQTYSNIEIIVIDNNSIDATKGIANQYTQHVFNFGPERSAQRNFGAMKAKGKYVVFLDADMILEPTVIEECVQMMQTRNQELLALVIPEKSIGTGFWTACKALERSYYEGVDWMEAARWYKKTIFIKLKGYDETLTGPEDFELPQRVIHTYGNVIGRIHSYIFHDEGNLTLAKTLTKKYYYGRKMRRYRQIARKSAFMKQSSLWARYALFIKHPKKLLDDPIHALGMFVLKTAEMIALGLGGMIG